MELAGLNIKFLPGVGEKKAAVLYEELQVQSYEDMLYHVPFKYIDRSKIYSIAELNGRLPYIQIKAKIRNLKTIGEGKALRMTATAYDETGTLELVWFKGFKFLTNQIEPDKEYLIFGQPSEFKHKKNIVHPEIDSFEKASQLLVGFQAVYPTTEKMKKAFLNSKAISKIQDSIFKTIKGKISETLPAWFIQQHKLMYLHEALYNIHFPENPDMLRKALFRLKFEELFYIQLNILKLKYKRKTYFKGHEFKTIGEYFNKQALEYIEDDELVEVTPLNIRLRKLFLTELERRRNRFKTEARQRVRPAMDVDTSEDCPSCFGTGTVKPSILFTDSLEEKIDCLVNKHHVKKFTLHVHPYVAAYVNKGLFPLSMKWKMKYTHGLKVIPNQSLAFLEYKFFDADKNELDMKEEKEIINK